MNKGSIFDPFVYSEPLDVSGVAKNLLLTSLEKMILIRSVERKIAFGRKNGLIGGPVHLGVGQEAIAVGISTDLNSNDFIFGAHRSHSHLLALGGDVRKLFSEVLGKDTGHSRGMGGSMHLWDKSVGFHGSVPIVAGTVSLAVGTSLASKLKTNSNISIVYLGDGACEEGVVHECLNFASINKLPLIFVVENNLFSSHLYISMRQPNNFVSRFAEANKIKYKVVDGNNFVEIHEKSKEFIRSCREGSGPFFLEAITYRWYGHVDWREDIDVGVNRSKKDLEGWKKRDPIKRLLEGMIENRMISRLDHEDIEERINNKVEKSWELALNDPYPESSSLLERVYTSN